MPEEGADGTNEGEMGDMGVVETKAAKSSAPCKSFWDVVKDIEEEGDVDETKDANSSSSLSLREEEVR